MHIQDTAPMIGVTLPMCGLPALVQIAGRHYTPEAAHELARVLPEKVKQAEALNRLRDAERVQ